MAVLPLLILPTRSAGRSRLKYATQTQAKTDEMNQVINETLSASGSLLVKMFTREDCEYEKFEHVNKEVTDLSMRETRSGSLFSVAMGMFTQLGPLLIYFAGGLLIIEKFDIIDGINALDEMLILFGIPVAFFRENIVMVGIFAVKIVIAQANKSRGNFAKLCEPTSETLEVGRVFDIIKRID